MNKYTSTFNKENDLEPIDDHKDTKKVVDTAAKGAAEYFAPGVGSQAYDAAKKIPVVGEEINHTVEKVSKTADQIPGIRTVSKKINDSGITDAANQTINFIGANSTKKVASNGNTQVNAENEALPQNFRKNNTFNQKVQMNKEIEENEEAKTASSQNTLEKEEQPEIENIMDDKESSDLNNEKQELKGTGKTNFSKKILSFIAKNPWVIVLIIGLLFFLLLLFIILGGDINESINSLGYYDVACNFNETKVTVMSCDEKDELLITSLDDYVIHMMHAYMDNSAYSDEALKAAMIAIKTDALSYGNYNSSNKNIEVRICDVFSDYDKDPSNTSWMFENVEENKEKLTTLYNQISEYIYVSSSYTSSISSLSVTNSLKFNKEQLEEFESLAKEGQDFSMILDAIYKTNEEEENMIYRDNLFIGDSRMKGILDASLINQNNSVYGVGLGYNWLVGTNTYSTDSTNASSGAIKGLNMKMKDNTSYNIIIWLGVNDLGNIENYYEEYERLASNEWKNHQLYIVSVGPVDDELSKNVTNEMINQFNEQMKENINNSNLENLKFIDLNYDIEKFDTREGLHYSNADSKKIYNEIISNVSNGISKNLKLYKLSDYCTYYNLTENDAYWWPVGSATATEGNIYGGDPVSTTIKSYFGPRVDPITHVYQARGHGAIDIGGVGYNTPVIATKDGTITKVVEGCIEGNLECGGTYGNHVIITHDTEISSLYAHLTRSVVKEGEPVKQGQIIGYTGSTGRSTGPHLHFEIRLNGTRVDPLNYVSVDNPRPIAAYKVNYKFAGSNSDYKQAVCSTLLASGISKEATIGILANLSSESGILPYRLQGDFDWDSASKSYPKSLAYTNRVDLGGISKDDFIYRGPGGGGYGLAQWTSAGRKNRLYEFAKTRNKSIGDVDVQLEYLLYELENYYPKTYKKVTGTGNALEIGAYWCDHFESPGGSEPCSIYGTTCPSNFCSTRTKNAIETHHFREYVYNNCSE